jgi:peptide/nickel transport system substrate-binding protein
MSKYVQSLQRIEIVDRYTIKMTLKDPNYALFESQILFWGLRGLGDPEEILKDPKRPVKVPVGTGPFKFVEWVAGDHLTIERNENYWGKRPYLDRVIFRFLPDDRSYDLRKVKPQMPKIIILAEDDWPSRP